jgi:molecular chaperone GrpE (heat shock protein)
VLPLPYTLNNLALLIDRLEERIEKTSIPFLQKQIGAEIERLSKRFEAEYDEFLATNGQSHAKDILKPAV